MLLLAVDTATNSGGVAVARNSEVVGLAMVKTPLRYSDHLMEYIEFLLGQLEFRIGQVDGFAVAVGPGSFTGLRIGIAAAKALAQGLDRPAMGISTLEALAWRFRHVSGRVAPMVDARRQQIFGAVYAVDGEQPRLVEPETVAPPAAWLSGLPAEPCLYVGDGAQMYASTVAGCRPEGRLLRTDNCILSELCDLAFRRVLRGETGDAASLTANYVRPSDAELVAPPDSGRGSH